MLSVCRVERAAFGLALLLLAPTRAAHAVQERTGPALAMVLLPEAKQPAAAAVVKALGALDPALRAVLRKEEGGLQSWDLPDHALSIEVMLVRLPVPKDEARDAARFSAHSLAKGWKPAPHVAHLLVAGKAPGWRKLGLFTRFLAALARAGEAAGVYWGAGHVTHEASFFARMAAADDLPIVLWSGVSVAGDRERVSLLSLGMEQFGLPDLLLEAPRAKGADAMAFLYELLDSNVREGKPIPEGDTVGRNAQQRLPVRYRPSPIDPKKRVWSVSLP